MSTSQLNISRLTRHTATLAFTLLIIEFLDEFVFGMEEAAWPLIRSDLNLNYAQIGLLISLPILVGNILEPALGILGDTKHRRLIILSGGLCFALACLFSGLAPNYITLLLAMMLFNPSSGAFVSLSQATLMDLDPERHEQAMARWTLAGSLGVVIGPLALGAVAVFGLGWRFMFIVFAGLALALTLFTAWQWRGNGFTHVAEAEEIGWRESLRRALGALRRREVWQWLVLLEFSDFMLDILLGFLALYMVDVAGASPALAGTAVAIWSGVGLLGDALLIPLLERVRGLTYLRWSAAVMLLLYPAFLLLPSLWFKLVLVGALGLFNSGWYAILKGQLYSSLPGQSATVMTLGSATGMIQAFVPALLGFIANAFGLNVMMWVLLLGPIALLIGLPRQAVSLSPKELSELDL